MFWGVAGGRARPKKVWLGAPPPPPQPLEVPPPAVRPPMARVATVRVAELLRPEREIVHSLSHRGGVHLRDGLLVGHHDVLAVHQLHVRFHHFVEHAFDQLVVVVHSHSSCLSLSKPGVMHSQRPFNSDRMSPASFRLSATPAFGTRTGRHSYTR